MAFVVVLAGVLACESRPGDGVGVRAQAIIGGQKDRQMPAVGALVTNSQSFCTATLIAKKVALTAAHCIDSAQGKPGLAFRVEVADSSTQGYTFHNYPIDSSKLSTHPQWTRNASRGFDVGFVILTKDVSPSHAKPMPYNVDPIDNSWIGKSPLFLGYGLIQTTPQVVRAQVKYGTTIPIESVQSDRIITRGNGKSVCHGDSGGPALAQFGGEWRVFAVNSYVTGPQINPRLSACRGTGASNRTDTYKAYIQQILKQHGDGGCTQHSECKPNERCTQGKCAPPPPDPCGNGKCEPENNESCSSCATDCGCAANQTCNAGICVAKDLCGNGTCDVQSGENCGSCAQDCACPAGQECKGQVCQQKVEPCGDGKCDGQVGENCATCALDCACPANQQCQGGQCTSVINSCGDGACAAGQENCQTCPQDCACPAGQQCQAEQCVGAAGGCTQDTDCPAGQTCQAGQCVQGTPSGCTQDTDCPAGQTCQGGQCAGSTGGIPGSAGGPCREQGQCDEGLLCYVNPQQQQICYPSSTPASPLLCPHYQHFKTCDPAGQNCRYYCLKAQGSGCQSVSGPQGPWQLWWLLLLGLPFWRMRQRARA